MKAIFIQSDATVPYTPAAAVNAGDVVVIGGIIGVAKHFIPALTLGALALSGLYTFGKALVAMTAGQALYWDAAAGVVTTDPAGGVNVYIGRAIADAASTDTTLPILLGDDRVPRQAVIAAVIDNSGGAVSTTLATGITDAVAKDAVASLAAKFNALLAACKAAGIVAAA